MPHLKVLATDKKTGAKRLRKITLTPEQIEKLAGCALYPSPIGWPTSDDAEGHTPGPPG